MASPYMEKLSGSDYLLPKCVEKNSTRRSRLSQINAKFRNVSSLYQRYSVETFV